MEGYLKKIPFLTIPPHSQLIHNHDAEVYALTASCLGIKRKKASARVRQICIKLIHNCHVFETRHAKA